jgi:hypothetical protein
MLLHKMTVVAAATALLFLCAGFTSALAESSANEQETMEMTSGLFKTKGRLDAVFPDFDFDAQCGVESFQLVKVSKRADPIIVQNTGSDFITSTMAIVNQAQPGDYYFFENIRVRCPNDIAARKLASIVVKIK